MSVRSDLAERIIRSELKVGETPRMGMRQCERRTTNNEVKHLVLAEANVGTIIQNN